MNVTWAFRQNRCREGDSMSSSCLSLAFLALQLNNSGYLFISTGEMVMGTPVKHEQRNMHTLKVYDLYRQVLNAVLTILEIKLSSIYIRPIGRFRL